MHCNQNVFWKDVEINVSYRKCPPGFLPNQNFLCNQDFSLQSRCFFAIRLFLCNQNVSQGKCGNQCQLQNAFALRGSFSIKWFGLLTFFFAIRCFLCNHFVLQTNIFFSYQKISFFQDNSNFFIVSPQSKCLDRSLSSLQSDAIFTIILFCNNFLLLL